MSKKKYKKIERLQFDYRPKNKKETEEIDGVLMQANELLECRNIIIEALKNGAFKSEHFKESDNAAFGYVLKDVNKFIEEIKSMEEKINLDLFK